MKKIIFALFFIAQSALAEISTPITGMLDNGFRYTILPLHDDKGRLELRHANSLNMNVISPLLACVDCQATCPTLTS
ncbi:MAG: hypothetical protein Q4B79_05175 [Moraxella sp.]|uniref:hypothetical protein n=1 Tax=Moraxella sp. TaxID=479 RepID=UPI0026DB9D9E|nr:hypothetical protein [Moraxella sp.]MDO4450335.1 hypothetical protein [Moraxella sp.]